MLITRGWKTTYGTDRFVKAREDNNFTKGYSLRNTFSALSLHPVSDFPSKNPLFLRLPSCSLLMYSIFINLPKKTCPHPHVLSSACTEVAPVYVSISNQYRDSIDRNVTSIFYCKRNPIAR